MAITTSMLHIATAEMNRDPLSHLRTSAGWLPDSDRTSVTIVPELRYVGGIDGVDLLARNVSEQTMLWEHQVAALEQFIAALQANLERVRTALENRRTQERAI